MDDLLQMPDDSLVNYKHESLDVDPRNNLLWKNKEFVVGRVGIFINFFFFFFFFSSFR
jgi:hypothetical protein